MQHEGVILDLDLCRDASSLTAKHALVDSLSTVGPEPTVLSTSHLAGT